MKEKLENFFKKKRIMGILNCTPDSFSDGGEFFSKEDALKQARRLVEEGADILDIGGESTRPGAQAVSYEEERARVIPVLKELRLEFPQVLLSLDTQKASLADEALELGVDIINDVSGLRDSEMLRVLSKFKKSVVLMHMRGDPQTMQKDTKYENVVEEILLFFEEKIKELEAQGIQDIILDPGIGFGKGLKENIELLRNLEVFRSLGYPVLIGVSRKSFLGKITGSEVHEREEETLSAQLFALMKGADIIRSHNVHAAKKSLLILEALEKH